MKPVTAETVRAEIARLEGFTACTTRPLSMTEEFHLSIARDWLRKSSWIKCVDRLPDKSGDYLVLCYYPKFHERCFVQHVMNFLHTAYETPVMRWYDSERAPHIVAWMPLPDVVSL